MAKKAKKELRPVVFARGARFVKFDLQVHSPRDQNWGGERPQSVRDRETYAADFVAHCRARGLGAVAITDHHDMCFVEYIRNAARAELDASGKVLPRDEQLLVFPGVEVTLNIPGQALIIFDAELAADRFPAVLTALVIDPKPCESGSGPSVEPLPWATSVDKVKEVLDQHDWLVGRYIILPHVKPGGHKSIISSGQHLNYASMHCVGGYVDGSIDVVDSKPGKRNILNGKDPKWGSKRIAVFETSDNRTREFDRLGQYGTWIKISTPTAEALRQACLAPETRVSQADPTFPSSYIRSVDVVDATFLGTQALALNPQYSVLVGGRGTGKSSMLEYLRWALCDEPVDADSQSDIGDLRARRRSLIESTLSAQGACVLVTLEIDGAAHEIRRWGSDGSTELRVEGGNFEPLENAQVRAIAPLQAYSQKQLSTVAVRTRELSDFLIAPIRGDRVALAERRAAATSEFREAQERVDAFRRLERSVAARDTTVASLRSRAIAIKNAMSGLSDSDREVLEARPAALGLKAVQAEVAQGFGDVYALLTEARDRVEALSNPTTDTSGATPQLRAAAARFTESIDGAADVLRDLVAGAAEAARTAVEPGGPVESAAKALEGSLAAYEEAQSEVAGRAAEHRGKVEQLAAIDTAVREEEGRLSAERKKMVELAGAIVERDRAWDQIADLDFELFRLLETACVRLSELSNKRIGAKVLVRDAMRRQAEEFRDLVAGAAIHQSKIDKLFDSISSGKSPYSTLRKLALELEALALVSDAEQYVPGAAKILEENGFKPQEIGRAAAKFEIGDWAEFAVSAPAIDPVFTYRTSGTTSIAFENASAGQQASALLASLLEMDGPTLIVDQPEDDLDSETIEELIADLWSAKKRRQVVFATHSANLVVNGDADFVAVFGPSGSDEAGGQIEMSGDIDRKQVREKITAVMEGGEAAFMLRKAKYGF